MFIIYSCFTVCSLLIYIVAQCIIIIPLADKFNTITQQEHLYFDITDNYSVYLNSNALVSSLSINYFLKQFTQNKQPTPTWKSSLFSLNGTPYTTISHYSLKIKVLNLNTPIQIEFETHEQNNTVNEENDFFVFQRRNQFINDLYTKHLIQNNMYIFDLNNDKRNEVLYIGGIPSEIISQINDTKPIVNVSSKDIFGMTLQIGNRIYNNNSFFTWNTLCTKKMKLDKRTFNSIVNDLFSEYLRDKTCEVENNTEYVLQCMKDVVVKMNLPKIQFISKDNGVIEFKNKGLFSCDLNNDKCEAMFTAIKGENSYWSVGYALLKDYITVVDNENDFLLIYDKKEEMEFKYKHSINWFKMEICLLISGVFLEMWLILQSKLL